MHNFIFSSGGDSKTLMVVQVAPVRKNEGETYCSLDFAQRVKSVELGQATKKIELADRFNEVGIVFIFYRANC